MNPKIAVVLLATLIAGAAASTFACSGHGNTDSARAHELVAAGARLLDVRTPEEFAAGHIEGAVNIPVQSLPARLAEVGPTTTPLVVYCRSGKRSATATRILQDAGFTSVHDLGAMSAWGGGT